MKRFLVAGAFVFAFVTPALAEQLCRVRSRQPQVHDDAQPASITHEEHGRPLQDQSRGPRSHGQHERVRRLRVRNSPQRRSPSAASTGASTVRIVGSRQRNPNLPPAGAACCCSNAMTHKKGANRSRRAFVAAEATVLSLARDGEYSSHRRDCGLPNYVRDRLHFGAGRRGKRGWPRNLHHWRQPCAGRGSFGR
jgi:hypothetical protein